MNRHQIKQWLFNNLIFGENGTPNKDRYTAVASLLVPPPTGKIWGIDISHWNLPPVNLKRMKDLYGLSFVIIKGCDGTLQSKYFADHVAAARQAGIPFMFYDWLYPGSKISIDAQTTAWANQYKAYPDCKGIRIDAEWTTYAGAAANPSANDLRAAHDSLYKKINKKSGTYTAKGYADQYLKGFVYKADEPLWVAHYGVTAPSLPIGATTYQMWQFTSMLDGHALDPNGNKELDGDLFNGTAGEFAAQFGTVSEPEPPVQEENMIYINRVNSSISSLRVRTSPDNTNDSNVVPNLVLTKGDILVCDQYQNGWYHVFQAVRGSLKISLPAAGCWAGDGTAGTYQDELVKFGAETPPASDVWTKDEKNSLLFDVAEIKADIGNIAGALVSQSQTLAAILNKLDALSTPATPQPTSDGYTGPTLGIYEIISTGTSSNSFQPLNGDGGYSTVMQDRTVNWMAANCQGWDDFVHPAGSVEPSVKFQDGFWYITSKAILGAQVRVAEIVSGRARIVGMDADGDPRYAAVNLDACSPEKTPYYFHKIPNVPRQYPIIQPRGRDKSGFSQCWWIPASQLRKIA